MLYESSRGSRTASPVLFFRADCVPCCAAVSCREIFDTGAEGSAMRLSRLMRLAGWIGLGTATVLIIIVLIGQSQMPAGTAQPDAIRISGQVGMFLMLASIVLLVSAPLVNGIANRITLAGGRIAEATIL